MMQAANRRRWWTTRRKVWLSLALLFSIALNWPIAWFWVLSQPGPGTTWTISISQQREWWNKYVPNGNADPIVKLASETRFFGYSHARLQGGRVGAINYRDPRVRNLKLERAGFPFRSLQSYRWWNPATGENVLVHAIAISPRDHISWLSDESYYTVDSLPYQPLWLGLILNSLVYFALMAGPFVLGPPLIRWMNALGPDQGKCPRCKYDLRASEGCPECGWKR